MEKLFIKLDEKIEKIIVAALFVFLFIDIINGFLLRANIINVISLSQIFKFNILLLMLYLILKKSMNKLKTINLVYLCFFLILIAFLKEFQQIIDLLKFSLFLIFFYFGKIYLKDKKIVDKIFLINFLFIVVNIFLGILGLGFPQYQANSIGTRGFFYAGNDLTMVFLILSFYILFIIWYSYNKKFYYVFSMFLYFLAVNLATKSSILGIIIITLFFPLKNIKITKENFKKILFITFILMVFIIFLLKLTVFEDLIERNIAALNRYNNNIISTILSGRDIAFVRVFEEFKRDFSLFRLFIGMNKRVVIEMELFDIFFNYGLLGLFLFVGIIYEVYKDSFKYFKESIYVKDILFLNLLMLLFSFLSGHVFLSASVNVFISLLNVGLLNVLEKKAKSNNKRIFLISNMYPSEDNPYFGVFVKNTEDLLAEHSYITTQKAVINRTNLTLGEKIKNYLAFYFNIIYLGLKVEDYDIIYAHFITHSSIPLISLKFFVNKPLIINTHGSDVLVKGKLAKILSFFSSIIVKLADLIVVPSDYFKEIVSKKFNVSEEKIIVFPSGGIDCTIFFPDKGEKNENYVLGFVSRIEKGKGWDIFIDIIQKFNYKYPHISIEGIIIGDGKDGNKCLQKIDNLNLTSKIKFLGGLPPKKLKEYYNKFDILIFPTRLEESLGLVGLEAMACKTPVIASNIGGIRTYIKDNVNGFLVDVDDIDGFIETIYKYLNLTEKEKEKICDNAYQTSLMYDKKRVINNFIQRLQLIERKK
ncbi:Glycosyltransferase involved in cell wall bisynthesis [Anaerobranca californiensis DSM 14826]|jgi:glycosyltransferase involved in cell wall biosynthesis|uniref:Glycosyltransferase involved in cell wall bisynthesis n=1 Tax=Anaerobranca californiensis DSM 14826 TaxID=1120989 RepID=A0A1M6NAZ7_9FIRM|nr:glycosyltransferase [Anaerobranca californiensis]SHJ92827.1 Glycosyltransferase involved in cell wall bisynthesis [Anaerobranca californiensis DSM 14826]